MQNIQKRKLRIGIIIGVVCSIVTLVALFIIFMMLFLFGGPAETTTDISKYEETLAQYEGSMRTALIIFPEQIPESAQNTDFYFYYKDTWNNPTLEVYLQCTYDEADYQAEIARLESTQKRYGSIERPLLRDEEGRFPYPVYIAVDSHNHAYEYALLSGERQITYIYTAYRNADDLKKVDVKYLPSDFDSRQARSKAGEGYSIYLIHEDQENGQVTGWQYDFTREPIAEVLEFHPQVIGYNWFTVCTRLDENDNEIIRYCAYVYYEDEHDSIYGYPEEIQYEELGGYEFKSVELNEDKTVATVTYYDGEEEKTMEYEIPGV